MNRFGHHSARPGNKRGKGFGRGDSEVGAKSEKDGFNRVGETGTNLYLGALFGIKTYMTQKSGWEKIASLNTEDKRFLERLFGVK